MLDLFPVELREPVWYILAGFILGFAVSTLWEWLYFRRFRTETVGDDGALRTVNRSEINNSAGNHQATTPILQASPEFEPASAPGSYRSPTVFLNRERPQSATPSVFTKTERTSPSDTFTQSPLAENSAVQSTATESTWVGQRAETDVPVSEDEPQPTVFSTALAVIPQNKKTKPYHSNSGNDTPASADAAEPDRFKTPTVELGTTEDVGLLVGNEDPESNALAAETIDAVENDTAEALHKEAMPKENTQKEITLISEQNNGQSRVPRSRGYPDDLTKIRGIGEVYKRRLFAAHIFTFHHVATSDVEVLRRATQAAPNANIDSWPPQAEALAQKYQRANASYSGPLPDDLQQIPGIGPYFAQTLYRSGICTFEQLADSSLEELGAIFPPSVLGREIDLQQWLDIAREEVTKRR